MIMIIVIVVVIIVVCALDYFGDLVLVNYVSMIGAVLEYSHRLLSMKLKLNF